MSRLDSVIERIERGEVVDLEQVATLQALDCAKMGEEFADELKYQFKDLANLDRYSDLEEAEFYGNGDPKLVRFKNRSIEEVEFYENGALKRVVGKKEEAVPNG